LKRCPQMTIFPSKEACQNFSDFKLAVLRTKISQGGFV